MKPIRSLGRLGHWLRRGGTEGAGAPRFYAYLGPDLALTALTDGHYIYVDPADEQIAPHLIARGYWESWIDAAVARMVRRGDRVVEVGANLGYYTLKMARLIGPDGRLEAFEASPFLAGLVSRSVSFNGYDDRVRVNAVAVCDHAGELRFSVSRRHGGSGYLEVAGAQPDGAREVITVPCVKLDDMIGDDRPIDFCRMDAEGSEPLVLEGMRSVLARSPNIRICMEWGVLMMSARRSVPELVGWLRKAGFRFWLIETDGSLPELSDDALSALPLNDVVIARAHPCRAPG